MNALIYGSRQHWRKLLHQHRLLQPQLPAQLRQLGWQLFRFQQHYHAWHYPTRAHTIGHPTLPPVLVEIHEWSQFLGLTEPVNLSLAPASLQDLKRFNEFTVLHQLILPPNRAKKDNTHEPTNYRH